jgi:hypothetical protein
LNENQSKNGAEGSFQGLKNWRGGVWKGKCRGWLFAIPKIGKRSLAVRAGEALHADCSANRVLSLQIACELWSLGEVFNRWRRRKYA